MIKAIESTAFTVSVDGGKHESHLRCPNHISIMCILIYIQDPKVPLWNHLKTQYDELDPWLGRHEKPLVLVYWTVRPTSKTQHRSNLPSCRVLVIIRVGKSQQCPLIQQSLRQLSRWFLHYCTDARIWILIFWITDITADTMWDQMGNNSCISQ